MQCSHGASHVTQARGHGCNVLGYTNTRVNIVADSEAVRGPDTRQSEGCDHVGVRSEESRPQCPKAILIFVFCA